MLRVERAVQIKGREAPKEEASAPCLAWVDRKQSSLCGGDGITMLYHEGWFGFKQVMMSETDRNLN